MVDDLNETTSLTREITYHLRSGRRVRTFFRSPNFVTAVRSCITFYQHHVNFSPGGRSNVAIQISERRGEERDIVLLTTNRSLVA